VISSLEAFEEEEETQIEHIAGFLEANQLGLSTWQPFTPLAPVFQNSAAHSQLSDFSSQAFSSQEPTRIPISTISTSTKLKKNQTSPRRETSPWPPKHWRSSRPPTRKSTTRWTKPWTESRGVCEGARNWQKRCPDQPGQSNTVKHWTKQALYSEITNQNQNTSCQNTPPVTDNDGNETPGPEATDLQQPVQRPKQKRPPNGSYKTWPLHYFRSRLSPQSEQHYTSQQESDAPNVNQASTHLKSQTYWITKPVRSIAKTKYWGKRLLKSYIRTPISRTKSPPIARRHQKNSKRIQLWLWSQKPFQPICSLSTAKTRKSYHKKKICPHGGSHFSKTKSESENYSEDYNQQSESYDPHKIIKSKDNRQSENKDVTVKTEKKRETLVKTAKANVTAKADEGKAIEKTLQVSRAEKEKQVDTKIEAKASVTLPPHFATTFNIPILTFSIFTFTYHIFSIFNPLVAEHHFQTFTIGDLSFCTGPCSSRRADSAPATTTIKAFANSDSIRLSETPETQPDLHFRSLPRNPIVPKYLLSGQVRKSENDRYNDSFIFNYLDSSRQIY